MKITEVRIYKTSGEGPVKAFASVTIDGGFAVHGVRVIEGSKGAFIAFPSRKGKDGKWHDICHPISQDVRQAFSDAVLDAYNKA